MWILRGKISKKALVQFSFIWCRESFWDANEFHESICFFNVDFKRENFKKTFWYRLGSHNGHVGLVPVQYVVDLLAHVFDSE